MSLNVYGKMNIEMSVNLISNLFVYVLSTECNSTSWGQDCQKICGQCLNGDACNISNGDCPYGKLTVWQSVVWKKKCIHLTLRLIQLIFIHAKI